MVEFKNLCLCDNYIFIHQGTYLSYNKTQINKIFITMADKLIYIVFDYVSEILY